MFLCRNGKAFVLREVDASEKEKQGRGQIETRYSLLCCKKVWQMKSNTSCLIKEIKKNVEGRGKSCCFMSLHGNTVKVRKMLPLNPDVFSSNEGIFLVSQVPFPPFSLTLLGNKTISHAGDVDGTQVSQGDLQSTISSFLKD